MSFDLRTLGVATAGFCSFVNLYWPQALLPELAREFHVGAGAISSLMTAEHGGDRAVGAVHRRACRRRRTKTADHGRDVCGRDPDRRS